MTTESSKRATIYAMTSGKGGVGKTTSVINISVELARQEKKVIMIDADIGLANLHLRFDRNISKKGTILTLLESGKKDKELLNDLDGIISRPSESLELYMIPGSTVNDDIFNLDAKMKKEFVTIYRKLSEDYDYVIFDCGAGITKTNTFFEGIADRVILCTLYEEAAVIGAYSKIKVNVTRSEQKNFAVLVNKATEEEGKACYKTLSQVAEDKLNLQMDYLGHVRKDDALMRKCGQKRRPVYFVSPYSDMQKDYSTISRKLLQKGPEEVKDKRTFLNRLRDLLFP